MNIKRVVLCCRMEPTRVQKRSTLASSSGRGLRRARGRRSERKNLKDGGALLYSQMAMRSSAAWFSLMRKAQSMAGQLQVIAVSASR
jgi:hypothetical protein